MAKCGNPATASPAVASPAVARNSCGEAASRSPPGIVRKPRPLRRVAPIGQAVDSVGGQRCQPRGRHPEHVELVGDARRETAVLFPDHLDIPKLTEYFTNRADILISF